MRVWWEVARGAEEGASAQACWVGRGSQQKPSGKQRTLTKSGRVWYRIFLVTAWHCECRFDNLAAPDEFIERTCTTQFTQQQNDDHSDGKLVSEPISMTTLITTCCFEQASIYNLLPRFTSRFWDDHSDDHVNVRVFVMQLWATTLITKFACDHSRWPLRLFSPCLTTTLSSAVFLYSYPFSTYALRTKKSLSQLP